MHLTLLQRLGRGVTSSALGQIIAGLNSLLLVPLFLRAWGAEGYGQWLTLTALISYLKLLDLGGQSYVGNLLALAYARQDKTGFQQVLSTGVSLFTFICLGALVIIILLVSWPNNSFFGLAQPLNLNDRLVLASMSASLLLSIVGGVYVTVYRSTGRYARGAMVGNLIGLVILGTSAGMLLAKVQPGVFAVGLLGQNIWNTLVVIWDTRRQIPESRGLSVSLVAARRGLGYLGDSFYFWLIALAGALNQQGLLLLLTSLVSPVAVALFATHRTVAGLLRYVSTLLQGPLWPEFSFLWAQKRHNDMERVIVTTTGLMLFSSGLGAIALYIFFPAIYPLWTGRTLAIQMPLFSLLLLQGVLMSGWVSASWSLMACNQHRTLAFLTLMNAIVTIISAVLLIAHMGTFGAVLASLIGDVTCGLLVTPWLTSRRLQISGWRIYRTNIVTLIVLVPFGIAAVWLSTFLAAPLALLGFSLLAIGLSYPALIFILGGNEVRILTSKLYQAISMIYLENRVRWQPTSRAENH